MGFVCHAVKLDDLAEESFVINGPCRGYPTVGILQRACWASRKPFLTPARTVDQSFRNALNLAQVGVSDILKAVKTLRIVLGILAIIPLALLADKIFFRPIDYDENSLRTLAYLVFGVPILTSNLWVWLYKE